METTVPSVKSLLVRARISLAEASQARLLTCGEVRVELSEAAEGLRKVSGPVRRHVRECDECSDFRSQVRSNEKALAALFPVGGLLALKGFIASKLGLGGAGGAGSAGAAGAGAAAGGAAGAGAVGSVGAALSGGSAAGGIGAVGGAIGTKAVAGVVTAAVITAGAGRGRRRTSGTPVDRPPPKVAHVQRSQPTGPAIAPAQVSEPQVAASRARDVDARRRSPTTPAGRRPPPSRARSRPAARTDEEAAGQSDAGEESISAGDPAVEAVTVRDRRRPAPTAGVHSTGGSTVVVTVGEPRRHRRPRRRRPPNRHRRSPRRRSKRRRPKTPAGDGETAGRLEEPSAVSQRPASSGAVRLARFQHHDLG